MLSVKGMVDLVVWARLRAVGLCRPQHHDRHPVCDEQPVRNGRRYDGRGLGRQRRLVFRQLGGTETSGDLATEAGAGAGSVEDAANVATDETTEATADATSDAEVEGDTTADMAETETNDSADALTETGSETETSTEN